VVQVVELTDRRDPGQRHLPEGGAGEGEIEVGLDRLGDLVHPPPPRPEVPALRLGAAAQRPLEGVRVCVRQSRDGQSGQRDRLRRGVAHRRCDRADALAVELDQHPRLGLLAAEPGELAPEGARAFRAHDPSSSVSRVTRRTNSSR
jgi:hypothetical protein